MLFILVLVLFWVVQWSSTLVVAVIWQMLIVGTSFDRGFLVSWILAASTPVLSVMLLVSVVVVVIGYKPFLPSG